MKIKLTPSSFCLGYVWVLGYLECGMFGMCDVGYVGCWDVEFSGYRMLEIWHVWEVRHLGCGMLMMWYVWDVGCSGFGMLEM